MPRIRVPGRTTIRPTADIGVGAGLKALGNVLETVVEARINRELLDIQQQIQVDQLDQEQFERLTRSEVISQFTAKQIRRNAASEDILTRAGKARDYGHVQKDMNTWEENDSLQVFEGRSQLFKDTFEIIDRSARVGEINQLANAVQKGNLGIIRDNFQISLDNRVEAVDASSDPRQINEDFDVMREVGVNMGMTAKRLDDVVGGARRDAMDRYVGSLPLVAGVSALSDPDVVSAYTSKELGIRKRDLNAKKNALIANQKFVNEAFARTTSINALGAFNLGTSQSDINRIIEDQEDISPTIKKDMLDFMEALFLAKEIGPKRTAPEDVKANEAFMENRMDRLVKNYNSMMATKRDSDEKKEGLLEINSLAIAVLSEATRLNVEGELSKEALVDLTFDMAPINEGLFVTESEARGGISGILDRIENVMQNGFGPQNVRIPSAIIAEELRKMTEGTGRYGGLSTEQRAVMRVLVINETVRTDGFKDPVPIEDAQVFADKVLTKAGNRFTSSEFGITGEEAERIKGLIFKTGPPATKARQQPVSSEVADPIRRMLSRGLTVEEVEAFAQTQPGFSQDAFNRAIATLGSSR